MPVRLVRSIRSSTGLVRANLSYIVKIASFFFHLQWDTMANPVRICLLPPVSQINFDPIDHRHTFLWPVLDGTSGIN